MTINEPFVETLLTGFIRGQLERNGFSRGILGLSGGLDSSVTAALAARAVGPNNVIALIMPYGEAFGRDADDARNLVKKLGIQTREIDIAPSVDAYYSRYPTEDRVLRGNKMARERMSVLYDFSVREQALILGTSNKTELLLGYGTIHGDMACAFNPIGDLYKTQLRQLARHLAIPESILEKAPTAGLWDGQTDEEELGLSYEEIDRMLIRLVDSRQPPEQLEAEGFDPVQVRRIVKIIRSNEFKRRMPPIAKLSDRTVGLDFLYAYDHGK